MACAPCQAARQQLARQAKSGDVSGAVETVAEAASHIVHKTISRFVASHTPPEYEQHQVGTDSVTGQPIYQLVLKKR